MGRVAEGEIAGIEGEGLEGRIVVGEGLWRRGVLGRGLATGSEIEFEGVGGELKSVGGDSAGVGGLSLVAFEGASLAAAWFFRGCGLWRRGRRSVELWSLWLGTGFGLLLGLGPVEDEDRVAKLDVVAVFEDVAALLLDFFAVESSAVGCAEVDEEDFAVFSFDTAVFAGALDIHDNDVGCDSTSQDISTFGTNWECLSLIRAFNYFENGSRHFGHLLMFDSRAENETS